MNVPLTPIRFLYRARDQFGRKVGIVDEPLSWTYQQYYERCVQLANLLLSWNLKPSSRVAFLSYNTHYLLEAYYGVLLARGIFIPLNIRLNPSDFRFILNDCQAEFLFFHPDFLPAIKHILPDLPGVQKFISLEPCTETDWVETDHCDILLSKESKELAFDVLAVDENTTAELFYTSGTTDQPKGVMLTHRNLYLHALETAIAVEAKETDVRLHTIPLFHVNGWGTPQFLTCVGGRHVMLKKFSPEEVLQQIERQKVSVFSLVPSMATALLNYKNLKKYNVSSVKKIFLGGSTIEPYLVQTMEDAFQCQCLGGYGLTETSPVLTLATPKSYLELDEENQYQIKATTGYPIPGVDLKIVDDSNNELPWNGKSIGEIVVRGDMVMKGYWQRPEETRQAFKGGWFHTGDMAKISTDGYLLIVDRKKDIIVSGGENISSLELEKTLQIHQSVSECAVIAVPDKRWGEIPKALVVMKPGKRLNEDELLDHCRKYLAPFKVPASINFLDSLPRGGTGKVLKQELRKKY